MSTSVGVFSPTPPAAEPRPAPTILQIPAPPPRGATVPKVFGWIAGGELALGVVLLLTLPRPANYITGAVLLFQAALFGGIAAWIAWRMRQAHARDRPPAAATTQADAADPLVPALRGAWRDVMRPPQGGRLRKLIQDHPPRDESSARIVALGHVDVPRVGEFHFEPEIITPTRYIGRNLVFAICGLFFVGLAIAKWTHAVPGLARVNLGSFGYFYAMLAVVGATWVYRSAVRPTYIRLAPGVVEVLRFSIRGGPPDVRSYPLAGGTTIVLFAPWWSRSRRTAPPTALDFGDLESVPRRPFAAWLWRAGQWDYISFQQIRKSHELVDRFWQALLSTAPIPPLSRDELVG